MLAPWKKSYDKLESRRVVSDSLSPHGLYSPWNSPGQNTGLGGCSLFQEILPTQESNPGLLHCRWILYQLSYQDLSDKPRQHIQKADIILPTKVCIVKGMVFPVVMYGCERWTIKEAEHQRIDAFELWFWRRLLRHPWTERRSNQSLLKEINPECSLEELKLKLKLQYFGHLMRRADSLEKTLMLGKTEGRRRRGRQRRRRGWQRMRWLDGITDLTRIWTSSCRWWRTGKSGVLQSMGLQRVGHNWATEQQQDCNFLPR